VLAGAVEDRLEPTSIDFLSEGKRSRDKGWAKCEVELCLRISAEGVAPGLSIGVDSVSLVDGKIPDRENAEFGLLVDGLKGGRTTADVEVLGRFATDPARVALAARAATVGAELRRIREMLAERPGCDWGCKATFCTKTGSAVIRREEFVDRARRSLGRRE